MLTVVEPVEPIQYRVYADQSRSRFNNSLGFVAASDGPFQPDHPGFRFRDKLILEQHLDWRNRIPTPLVSTTVSRKHAQNIARGYEAHGDQNIMVAFIRPCNGISGRHLTDLIKYLHPKMPNRARAKSERLWIHRIPRECVMYSPMTLKEFNEYCLKQGMVGDIFNYTVAES